MDKAILPQEWLINTKIQELTSVECVMPDKPPLPGAWDNGVVDRGVEWSKSPG